MTTKPKTTKPSKPTTLQASETELELLERIIADTERLYSSDDVKAALRAVLERFAEETK